MTAPPNVSNNRLRLLTAAQTAPVVETAAFDPIPAGGIDHFGFDLSADAGAAGLVSTELTATFADDDNVGATDPDPASRILATWAVTEVVVGALADDTANTYPGAFTVAQIGGMPASAVGGAHTLTAATTFDDGRVIIVASDVLCS
jgi:hypothetical protein